MKASSLLSALLGLAGVTGALGCGSTEFHTEQLGEQENKTWAAVPVGMVGVCRRPYTLRPPIVNQSLWDHALVCKTTTPKEYVRLGFGNVNNAESTARSDRMMKALREGPRTPDKDGNGGGNTEIVSMLRTVRQEGLTDPYLVSRVARESARTSECDYSYLFNTMETQFTKLHNGDKCAVYAYDQVDKKQVCLFNTELHEATWLTSTWSCTTRTGNVGKGESCLRLCAYDDYCAQQVSCAVFDVDLTLCALGVCLPELEPYSRL
ncbi:MAG: hypothetical protein U0271_32735 [Polyangiaceae bacterium]